MRRPDFFIVGAPKCGTTAMQEYLSQHPDIFMPEKKEPHFFGSDLYSPQFIRDRSSYLRLFENATTEKRVGEASVWYLYSKNAAKEIKDYNHRAQAIVMLRNPVDMMYSLHSQFLYSGNENIARFAEALEAEGERKVGRLIPGSAHMPSGLLYREVARYSTQLKRYIEVFGWENLHVVVYDDLKADPAEEYRKVLHFLGVDESFQPEFKVINSNKRVRSRVLRRFLASPPEPVKAIVNLAMPKRLRRIVIKSIQEFNVYHESRQEMNQDLRHELQKEFAPEVECLSKILKRNLSHWYE